jgi:poly-gamma-glutamate synthesis protein (capsule biosynthesis protein)
VIARYDDTRPRTSVEALVAAAAAGSLLVPCELVGVTLGGRPLSFSGGNCLPAMEISAGVRAAPGSIALLPPGLVTPQVKVLPIGDADLFGSPKHRAVPYPLMAVTAAEAAWTAYDPGDVRTLISTGDTCPDRGVSHQAVGHGKGWDWVLGGGTAEYSGFHWSVRNWSTPDPVRTGGADAVADLIADNDIGVNDFECPMTGDWRQHDTGMVFSIDPNVALLLAGNGGVKTVTLGSNHMIDAGSAGISQTLRILDQAGIKHTGAGMNMEQALAPAIVEVRGVTFAFVGWDDGGEAESAGVDRPGVARMTSENMCRSLKAARSLADVVIAEPQWGSPEYHSDITLRQIAQRRVMYDCGADGILGSGTHWASWASILPGPTGPRFAIGSHGNFLFDQNWSRQTMEGVIVELTYVGTTLAQLRLHPYVIVDGGQPNLIDPTTDGRFVLNQVWSASEVR